MTYSRTPPSPRTPPGPHTPRTPGARRRRRDRVALGMSAAALTALLAAACGGDGDGDDGATTPPPADTTASTQVDATLSDFRITFSQQTFEPGAYTFTAKNTGQHDHALEFEGPGGENRSATVGPGESTTLKVTLESGTYEVYCPVDGHKDMGMKTEITVGGGTNGTPDRSPGTGY
ncbi:plastocyanin/azurin family copper-binding protein [Streptomyces sp. NPDC127114]|uniref:plastocyanin/azurin family copper-binding protein n=1 Tax=Streptomyces sp. NPDC127114 TaxID=3345366 RepID=UPI0036429A5B